MLDIFSLKGKLARFTGASRGLGKTMPAGLAKAGAAVCQASGASDDVNGTILTVDGGRIGR